MGDYENVIYLAFALAVVIISIVLMHIITSSKKLGSHPHRLPLYCCVMNYFSDRSQASALTFDRSSPASCFSIQMIFFIFFTRPKQPMRFCVISSFL